MACKKNAQAWYSCGDERIAHFNLGEDLVRREVESENLAPQSSGQAEKTQYRYRDETGISQYRLNARVGCIYGVRVQNPMITFAFVDIFVCRFHTSHIGKMSMQMSNKLLKVSTAIQRAICSSLASPTDTGQIHSILCFRLSRVRMPMVLKVAVAPRQQGRIPCKICRKRS